MGIYVALESASYVLPSWVNTEPLTVLSDLEWTEKNGKDYTYASDETSLGNNNLSWTSGTSKASYSSKSAYDKTEDYYYLSSEAFTVAGADKTSLKYTSSYSSSKWSDSITYSTGAATSTKEDDVTFSNSSSVILIYFNIPIINILKHL